MPTFHRLEPREARVLPDGHPELALLDDPASGWLPGPLPEPPPEPEPSAPAPSEAVGLAVTAPVVEAPVPDPQPAPVLPSTSRRTPRRRPATSELEES